MKAIHPFLEVQSNPLDDPSPILVGPEWGKIRSVLVCNPTDVRYPNEVESMLRATLPSSPSLDDILKNPGLLLAEGFRPIPTPFQHFQSLGGSFHCATCEVRGPGSFASTSASEDLHIFFNPSNQRYEIEPLPEFLNR